MKNVFVTYSEVNCLTTKAYLREKHGFTDYAFTKDKNDITSIWSSVYEMFHCLFKIIRDRKRFNHADHVMAVGNIAMVFFLLKKIGFLKIKHLYWFGFFLHNPKNIKVFKIIYRMIRCKDTSYMVYTEHERHYYAQAVGIPIERFYSVPYGYMEEQIPENNEPEEDYYFSGGYSNRDYKSLIEVFRANGKKLVIIGSKHNTDLNVEHLPDNITILKDVPKDVFERTLKRSKACIIPFVHNTGASGQMVFISCMMNRKAVIVSDTDSIREYLENDVSGIIVNNIVSELDDALERLENEKERRRLGQNLYERFLGHHTYGVVTGKISEMLNARIEGASIKPNTGRKAIAS